MARTNVLKHVGVGSKDAECEHEHLVASEIGLEQGGQENLKE